MWTTCGLRSRCLTCALCTACNIITLLTGVIVRQEPVRSAIARLCKISGIKVSDRLIRHKTTHLICCVGVGESDKLLNARAWGTVYIVSIDWLLQCIRTGRRASETEFLLEAAPAGLGQTAAAPGGEVSEPSAAARQQAAVSEPLALQKPQGDEPDCMLDFVAKLTSVAKATGKRCAHRSHSRLHSADDLCGLADAPQERSLSLLPAVAQR